MKIILNPTEWPIVVKWNGVDHVFKPDERKPVEDSMGRQVMHNYKQRGLVELNYGDEGEIELEKAKEGRERCDQFWTKQCQQYNQDNTTRKERNLSFVRPTTEVAFHAKRLGIVMIDPYKLEDTSSKEIKLLMDQNRDLTAEIAKKDTALAALQNQVAELTTNFQKFMALAGQGKQNPEDGNGGDMDPEAIKMAYSKMSKKNFAAWVINKWDEIQSYPDEVKDGIAVKHEKLFGGPLPKNKPAIESYGLEG